MGRICIFCVVGWILLATWLLFAIVLAVSLVQLTLPWSIVAAACVLGMAWTGINLVAWQQGQVKAQTAPVQSMTQQQQAFHQRPPQGRPPRGIQVTPKRKNCVNC